MRYKSLIRFPKFIEQKNNIFYAYIDGKQAGPMNESEMKVLINNGSVSSDTLVWMPQLVQWTQAQYVPIVNKLLLLSHKPLPKAKASSMCDMEKHPLMNDLIKAIIGLGYKSNIATKTADQVLRSHPRISIEEGIIEALKMLK